MQNKTRSLFHKLFTLKTLYLLRYRIIHKFAPFSFLDDKAYIVLKYYQRIGYRINLRTPTTFNDKLNWIKLYDRNPFYTTLSDKYLVRDYIAQTAGPQYLNKLIAVYNTPQEIDWTSLPDRFVLKVNHGCKFNIICRDKAKLDIPLAIRKLERWLPDNGYYHAREWPYKDIQPCILCEEYLDGDPQWGLLDYKFFCFNGEPAYIAVDYDRFTYHTQFFYNPDWERQPFVQGFPTPDTDAPRPQELDIMLHIARKLSTDIPFCRVDLYNFDHRVLFGEITFFPHGGFQKIEPLEYDYKLGEMIQLPSKNRHNQG